MEDTESHYRRKRTLKQQYQVTLYNHVMKYGDMNISLHSTTFSNLGNHSYESQVDQWEADLFYFQNEITIFYIWLLNAAMEGSIKKLNVKQKLDEAMAHRTHVDTTIELIRKLLFGVEKGNEVLNTVRESVIGDWDCLKYMIQEYETQCGFQCGYGLKHELASPVSVMWKKLRKHPPKPAFTDHYPLAASPCHRVLNFHCVMLQF
ncbi:legumain [Salvia divinorum]|uniref:Legumain n=1 Tax=Salvia divinorum TaxID=28513 RepID=A0ABD1FT95_SALDI